MLPCTCSSLSRGGATGPHGKRSERATHRHGAEGANPPLRLGRSARLRPTAPVEAVKIESYEDGSTLFRFDDEEPNSSSHFVAHIEEHVSLSVSLHGDPLKQEKEQQQQVANGKRAQRSAANASAADLAHTNGTASRISLDTGIDDEHVLVGSAASAVEDQVLVAVGAAHAGVSSRWPGTRDSSARSRDSLPSTSNGLDRGIEHHLPPLSSWLPGAVDRAGVRRQRQEPVVPDSVDVTTADALLLLRMYSDLSRMGQLQAAVELVEEIVQVDRQDVLPRLRHRHLLRAAAERKAVKEAFRFVQALPHEYVDVRSYTMLVSVCVAASDLRAALQAADMLKATGGKLDTYLYTNIMSACASVGDAATAFQLFAEMKAEAVKVDRHVASCLVKCCTTAMAAVPLGDRRQQLVLLERAFSVLDECRVLRVEVDAAVWNALINAAGSASVLERALQALRDMQQSGVKPNATTYATLVQACARSNSYELARKVYGRALAEGQTHSKELYSAAISACSDSDGHVNLEAALGVWNDMHRYNVFRDSLVYGQMMVVAGRANRLDLAFSLQDDMVAEGIKPSPETFSALILAAVANGQLGRAREAYSAAARAAVRPGLKAYNSLINAYGRMGRLGDVVSLVRDLLESGLQPDAYTYSAVLNTCQRADAAELAFEVVRVMKTRGVQLSEPHCFILLRLCYNRLRTGWAVGGYPPTPDSSHHMPVDRSHQREGRLLLELLAGAGGSNGSSHAHFPAAGNGADLTVSYDCSRTKWVSRAIAVYREMLAAGVQPRVHVLDRLMACLRQPAAGAEQQQEEEGAGILRFMDGPALSMDAAPLRMARESTRQRPGDIYDSRAVTLLEAAIFSGALPQFKLDGTHCVVDLRCMPPAVAEVYLLSVLNALLRRSGARGVTQPVSLLVPPYEPRDVFWPSYAERCDEVGEEQRPQHKAEVLTPAAQKAADKLRAALIIEASALYDGSSYDSAYDSSYDSEAEEELGGRRLRLGEAPAVTAPGSTGLGVAGVLRNLGIRVAQQPEEGLITLQPGSLNAWLREARISARAAEIAEGGQQQQNIQQKKGGGGAGPRRGRRAQGRPLAAPGSRQRLRQQRNPVPVREEVWSAAAAVTPQ